MSSPLFTPVKLGTFQLQNRLVISPPSHDSAVLNVEDYYHRVAHEGGLVIVPGAALSAAVPSHQRIANTIHSSNGIAFYRIDVFNGPPEGLVEELKRHVADAMAYGYDGVELNAAESSMVQRALISCQSPSLAAAKLVEMLQAILSLVSEDCVGIRFSPFAMVDGLRVSHPAIFYTSLVEAIKSSFPRLAFIHFVSGTTFDEFEYASIDSLDVFRAVVAFPCDLDGQTTTGPRFISSNDYSVESASAIVARTGELVAIGLASLSNSNIASLFRTGSSFQLPAHVSKRLADIESTFRTGKEYLFDWDSDRHARVMSTMNDIDSYLDRFDPALSYEGTDKKTVWRKSCWFASKGIAHPLLDTEAEIAKFDGDLKDGLSGLRALQDDRVRSSLEYLKYVLDSSLVTTSRALGINADLIRRCTVRYRIIKYTAHEGNPGGIGLHPDGNLLSALITNGPGLGVYDFDGTYREPGFEGTILMGGSTLYRWSQGTYLPTFHNVNIGKNQKKTSIVAFFNFPDMVDIPRSVPEGSSFFHDIRRIKEDDKSPTGELVQLWDVIIDKHNLVLPP